MCGIVGFFGQGDQNDLKRMVDRVVHRGPDERGFFFQPGVGLGHARLSILDLVQGQQPMVDQERGAAIVFNGEIYNFSQLRQELRNKSYNFKTNSDTEVILKAYAAFGDEFLSRLDGMFAFALWDGRKKRLVLARDRLGKKPLYWSSQKNNLVFASEIKALKNYPYLNWQLDRRQLEKYFFYDYLPCPYTPWREVYKLEPAQYLIFENNKIKLSKYWQPSFKAVDYSLDEARAELDNRLRQSVKERLVADVPLGIFLSGGLDSSAIAWYAAREAGRKIKTFSIDFNENTYGEGRYARLAAKSIGSDHQEFVLSAGDCLKIVPKLGAHMGEPLADASLLPTYILSDFTAKQVKVALGGDGADELFLGYQTFLAEKYYQLYKYLPGFLKKGLNSAVNYLPVSHSYFSLDFKLKKFTQARPDPLIRHQNWLSTFSLSDLPKLFTEFSEQNILEDLTVFARSAPADRSNKLAAFYQRFYMQERVMVKLDRASMLASLEVRSPFLDWRLVDFVNQLPENYKLRGLNAKFLLKQLMSDRLPEEIINRPKKGFSLPLGQWFSRGVLRESYEQLATRQEVEKTGFLRYNYIKSLLADHLAKKENNGQKLWSVLMFLMWQKHYGD
ncbi:MAG: asparagine synthase (glutamine-hydrolyzing) [bacterium]|nr:asparagine synthase (glutamine-hydrolyzing) [bacterium]